MPAELGRRVEVVRGLGALVRPIRRLGDRGTRSQGLLDAGRTGIVVTAIQGRDYARIYMKELDRGKPSVALSPEEQEAVDRAMGR